MKLIATNISNLTDARFFAAYMPDLLFLPFAKKRELEELLLWFDQVKSWIEGPLWGIELQETLEFDDLIKIKERGISSIIYSGDFDGLEALSEFSVYYSNPDDKLAIESLDFVTGVILSDPASIESKVGQLQKDIFVEISTKEEWHQLQPHAGRIQGVVLRGGDEEKVGIRSFEVLNDLLEELV